eukprot:TRINITY_DN19_c0_g1_i1.p1 TRINITY_DN19_c0_g1~~TRINITY_DN19_c0_g1_i1.p1  ORF type:complete len:560 (-),score=145.36 TRINITY_DN19_c0_g1_i1:218-1810(-)
MVVLTAAIVKSDKTLVARQFVEMTRIRVEGLLGAFSKLVDSGKDHTFVETESVRYVYQPMESLNLVVITNKASNILEDLETLRLLAKVVQDCCEIQVSEENVLKHAFDIVFAFDEVISFGYRESVTLSQIKTYTEMDSHEERLHMMVEQSKMNEAREMAKKKQMELAKQRAMQPKDAMPGIGSDSLPGISSSSFGGPGASPSGPGGFQESMSMGPASIGSDSGSTPWSSGLMEDSGPAPLKPGAPKKGMALSKKKPGDILGSMGLAPETTTAPEAAVPDEPAVPAYNPLMEPVKVVIEETVTANLQAEGGLDGEATLEGAFKLTVLDASKASLASFKLAPLSQEYKYKVHPNLNKQSHANNILEVRDASKAYNVNAPMPLVKWQMKSSNEDFLPVQLSCWPSATSDGTQIVLELELTDTSVTLEDVRIRFPAGPSSRPQISSAEPGEASWDGQSEICWRIPVLDKSEANGTFEFSASADSVSLMPFVFEAVRPGATKCPIEILECYHMEKKEPIAFACDKSCSYSFRIGA